MRGILEFANTSKHRRPDLIAEAVSKLIISASVSSREDDVLTLALLNKWLRRNEPDVISASSEAASYLFRYLEPLKRNRAISKWIDVVTENQGGE